MRAINATPGEPQQSLLGALAGIAAARLSIGSKLLAWSMRRTGTNSSRLDAAPRSNLLLCSTACPSASASPAPFHRRGVGRSHQRGRHPKDSQLAGRSELAPGTPRMREPPRTVWYLVAILKFDRMRRQRSLRPEPHRRAGPAADRPLGRRSTAASLSMFIVAAHWPAAEHRQGDPRASFHGHHNDWRTSSVAYSPMRL